MDESNNEYRDVLMWMQRGSGELIKGREEKAHATVRVSWALCVHIQHTQQSHSRSATPNGTTKSDDTPL